MKDFALLYEFPAPMFKFFEILGPKKLAKKQSDVLTKNTVKLRKNGS
jgi:hypothetical protein